MDENHQDKAGSKATVVEDGNKMPQHKKPGWFRRGFKDKTAWDYLDLLIKAVGAFAVPLTLIGLIINVQQFREQQANDLDKTINQQQQMTLENYLDKMSDLLFTDKLHESQPGSEVRSVARARTLTALQNLNSTRKGILLQFLYQSNLIQRPQANDKGFNPIIDLTYANLRDADLQGAFLVGANLSKTDLSGTNASNADLVRANLPGSSLALAVLKQAGLAYANLQGAIFIGTNLEEAYLVGADLSRANLSGANLSRAYLDGTNLSDVSLCGAYPFYMGGQKVCADLSGAHLEGAKMNNKTDLSETKLQGAKYNTKTTQMFDSEAPGGVLTLAPTQWPQGFDPKAAGAICVDC